MSPPFIPPFLRGAPTCGALPVPRASAWPDTLIGAPRGVSWRGEARVTDPQPGAGGSTRAGEGVSASPAGGGAGGEELERFGRRGSGRRNKTENLWGGSKAERSHLDGSRRGRKGGHMQTRAHTWRGASLKGSESPLGPSGSPERGWSPTKIGKGLPLLKGEKPWGRTRLGDPSQMQTLGRASVPAGGRSSLVPFPRRQSRGPARLEGTGARARRRAGPASHLAPLPLPAPGRTEAAAAAPRGRHPGAAASQRRARPGRETLAATGQAGTRDG